MFKIGVMGTELDVLKAVNEIGKIATAPVISGKVGITTGYTDLLLKSLVGKDLVAKTARGGFKVTSAAGKLFRDILGVEAGATKKAVKKTAKKTKKKK